MNITLNRILLSTTGFLSFGIALIILTSFWDAIATYHDFVARVLALCVIALSLSLAAYVCVNVFLALERRAIENKFFRESKQELQISQNKQNMTDADQDEVGQKILEMYQENASLNQIALEVYGKRGGAYNNKIREVLRAYEIEI